MPATNPIAARRPPDRAFTLLAELDEFDDVVDVVVDVGLYTEPEERTVLEGEVEFEDGVPLAAEALAVAWNCSNVSFAVGLIANTMPFWQWDVWRQYHQDAFVSLTVIVNETTSVALAETGSKPESTPPASDRHGAVKFDCVTVWFLGEKMNVIVSLAWAATLVGLKASVELAPTVTWWSSADAEVATERARIAEAIEKRIFNFFFLCCIVYGRAEEQIWKGRIRGERSCGDVEGLTIAVKRGPAKEEWRWVNDGLGERGREGDVPAQIVTMKEGGRARGNRVRSDQ
jgi:hypothetical protein